MSRASRVQLLQELEAARGRPTLSFFLGDRQNLHTQIASDSLSLASRLLEDIGRVPALDVFLYSTGGITMAAFAFVNLVREYTDSFSVIVPYKAMSAATLICLGANETIMMPMASLSPVDPSVHGPYNPPVPNQPPGAFPPQTIPMSVEDVASYIDLAREEARLKRAADRREVFLQLARDVRPLALGSVHRARTQIRMLSRKLLESHGPARESRVKALLRSFRIKKIVDTLTKELFSHDYPLSRQEARAIGLNVAKPEGEVEQRIMRLYQEYEKDLRLLEPYNPEAELGKEQTATVTLERAYIETTAQGYAFTSRYELSRITAPAPAPLGAGIQLPSVAARVISEGWRKL